MAAPRIFVLIPTIGRAACVRDVVGLLDRQTRVPDGVIVVGVSEADVAGVSEATTLPIEVALWQKGLTRQRNRALVMAAAGGADIVLFIDDDFVMAPTYLAELEAAFAADTSIAGITGRVIRDGVKGLPIPFAEAVALGEQDRRPDAVRVEDKQGLYGCNMAFRCSVIAGLEFDEKLPLYGWQEDVDFANRVSKRGRVVRMNTMAGVHMGQRGGRQPGRRLGYSQIANPVYLLRKRTIRPGLAYRIIWRNIASNLIRSIVPDPDIDRRGRALGNLIALKDIVMGRDDPERILEF